MTILEAIRSRHSVRRYKAAPIETELIEKLNQEITACNEESGLHIQLILNDPECFDTLFAHYGRFENAVNYIALVGSGPKDEVYERCGYYGERLVLFAETLGLKTCWVAGSYGKGKCKAVVNDDEKLACVISIGYGATDGVPHRSKPVSKVCNVKAEEMPDWFREGVEAALLAPTAINQQQFLISLADGEPVIKAKRGPYNRIDLGIVKYHFEVASGRKCK
jgi:nitroreductase